MSTSIHDLKDGSSSCCGAPVYMGGICSDCKEHCDYVEDEDEEENPKVFSKEQEAQIAKFEKECVDAGCDDNGHKHD